MSDKKKRMQKILKRLNALEAELQKLEQEYNSFYDAYEADSGSIEADERARLAKMLERLQEKRELYAVAYKTVTGESPVFNLMAFPPPAEPTKTLSSDEKDLFHGLKRETFKDAFKEGYNKWLGLVTDAVRDSANAADLPTIPAGGFSVSGITSVLLSGFSVLIPSGVATRVLIGSVNLLQTTLIKHFEKVEKTEELDPQLLRASTNNALAEYAEAEGKSRFDAFHKEWTETQLRIYSHFPDEVMTKEELEEQFRDDCDKFARNVLPGAEYYKKRFVQVLLENVPDKTPKNLWFAEERGASVELLFTLDASWLSEISKNEMVDAAVTSKFKSEEGISSEGEIAKRLRGMIKLKSARVDDAGDGLLRAIKETYGENNSVVDLPTIIKAGVFVSSGRIGPTFYVERRSQTPGDTKFTAIEENNDLRLFGSNFLAVFLRSKAIEGVKIGDLTTAGHSFP